MRNWPSQDIVLAAMFAFLAFLALMLCGMLIQSQLTGRW